MIKENTVKKKDFSKLPIGGAQPKSEKEEKYLREIGEYEFLNLNDNGLRIRFPYGSTNTHEIFTFFHGGKYKIPRHLARHVETRTVPNYSWRPNGLGQIVKEQTGTKPRFQMRQTYSE